MVVTFYLRKNITCNRRLKRSTTTMKEIWTDIENTVVKDVVRTDRNNPYFEGEDNPNMITMKLVGARGKILKKPPHYFQYKRVKQRLLKIKISFILMKNVCNNPEPNLKKRDRNKNATT